MRCPKCNTDNNYNAIFCTECGSRLKADDFEDDETNKKFFTQSIVLILSVVVVIIFSFQTFVHLPLLMHDIVFHSLLIIILTIFLFFDYKKFTALLKLSIKIKPVAQIICIAPVIAFLVILLSNFLIQNFGLENFTYFDTYKFYTAHFYIFGLLFVAVLPGIVEELLFRGLLFNYLLRFTRPKNVILVTAFIFSFVHFTFFSLLWLIPIGIILGYFRFRYKTIWYSVAFHMLYNASVFMLEPYLK